MGAGVTCPTNQNLGEGEGKGANKRVGGGAADEPGCCQQQEEQEFDRPERLEVWFYLLVYI